MKKLATRTLAILAVLSITACRDQAAIDDAVERADTGGVAVIAIGSDIDFANGLLSGERYSQEINRNMLFLPLLRYDENLQVAPLLAESWQMHGDTAVTLRLRRDVRWHDGVPTSAYDVEFTYDYGSNPETGYPNGDYWVGWNDVAVVDSYTVRFRIDRQPEALANLPWIPIMPRHLLGEIKPADLHNAPFNQKPVGNGPFKFVEYKPNDRWIFEANRDYPAGLGGRPNLDRVVVRIIPEQTAQEAELISGNVDVATQVRVERYAELDKSPDLYGIEKPGRAYAFVGWNTRRPPLDDARVRRGLTMGIDRQRIVDVLRKGKAEVAVGPVPPFHWGFDPSIKPLPFSPDSARALFAAAGMKDSNGDKVLELPNGEDFEIEIKAPSNNRLNVDMLEMIRSDLSAVGVRVVSKAMEFNTMIADVTSKARKFDAVLLGWESDFRLVIHDNFHSDALDNPFQFASYRNAEVDSLLDRIETTPDRAIATPLWRRFQTVLRDEQPWTFLYYYSDLFVARERLQNAKMDIRGVLTNVHNWSVRPQSD